ncbi:MAG: hypothetical protein M3143_02265 [Actinomycetota bacterium]|nr:hypothetical protein [Actinomycetota bacterium]
MDLGIWASKGFEAYLLALTAAWALMSWLGTEGETVAALFGPLGRHIWLGGLLASSVLALFGIALGTYTGLMLERAALFALAELFSCVGSPLSGSRRGWTRCTCCMSPRWCWVPLW